VQPVDESRTAIAFATEPIMANLEQLLKSTPQSIHSFSSKENDEDSAAMFELDELEIQKGLVQLGKALSFLHQVLHFYVNYSQMK
jgi:SCY1-like protein 2